MSTVETLPPPPARPNASPCAVHGCGDAADVRLSWPLVHPETRQTLSRGTLVCATCYVACRLRGAA